MTAFTLAAAGDAIITRRLSAAEDPALDALVDRLRDADASFVNLEVLLHDYEGYPAANSGGTYMRAPPWAADELTWAGFDVFAAANNHVGDFSHGGMEATMRKLDARSIPYAGLGETLADARAPAYVETPGGRVAVVSACSSITPGSEAGAQRPDMAGRPGLAPLRLDTTYRVPQEDVDYVRDLSERLGTEAARDYYRDLGFPVAGEDEAGFTLPNAGGGDLQFAPLSDVDRGDPHVERTPTERDREAFLDRVDAASRQADHVVASLHAHEGEGAFRNDPSVPEWMESFARDAVDAGADAFVGHGPHVLRGLELYEGAPIFYSLGNFMMQNETVSKLPSEIYDSYDLGREALPADLFDARVTGDDGERRGFLADRDFWETVLPVCSFEDGAVTEIELTPVTLGYDDPRPQRGAPRLAEGEEGAAVLETFAERSAPYGTEVEVEDGVGHVRP
jgi:poly-gamma-glutamate synthesis protein (capsule biosynthesis protein)